MSGSDVTRELADIQRALLDLADDAFAERYELLKRQDELRAIARSADNPMDQSRSSHDLLGCWIDPGSLNALRPGQVIDEDPVTGHRVRVESSRKRSATSRPVSVS